MATMTVSLAQGWNLADALNATGIVWSTSANMPWFGQTNVTFDGVAAAQSGLTYCEGCSDLSVTIEGPGTVAFRLKYDIQGEGNFGLYTVSDQEGATFFSGQSDWQYVAVSFGGGDQSITISHCLADPGTGSSNAVWVDEVLIAAPGHDLAPVIVIPPVDQTVGEGTDVILTATAIAYPPPGFRWQLNGADIEGETNSTLIFRAVEAARMGSYRVVVTNDLGQATSYAANLKIMTFAEALGTTNVVWTTVGGVNWFVQTNVTRNGISAAQSGDLAPFLHSSSLSATVTGPGVVSFWWKYASPGAPFHFAFSMESDSTPDQSAGFDWEHRAFYVAPGEQDLTWLFWRSETPLEPAAAWLSDVNFAPGETKPLIWVQPSNYQVSAWSCVPLNVTVVGTPPLSYQWQLNGVEIAGATNSLLELKYVQDATNGAYRVVVTNSYGRVVSSDAMVKVLPTSIVAWGVNDDGSADFVSATYAPSNLSNVVAIAAGMRDGLALSANGTVAAWGESAWGALSVPADLVDVKALAAGELYNLALKGNGQIVQWGWPIDPPAAATNVVAIASGFQSILALKADGTALGPLPDFTNLVAVSAGASHFLGVRTDGTVASWGCCNTDVPPGLSNVVAVAGGRDFSIALKRDGTIVCWGSISNAPPDLTNVISVAACWDHALALRDDGTVRAWGVGQSAVPPGLSNVIAIAAGGNYNLALLGPSPSSAPQLYRPTHDSTRFKISCPTFQGKMYLLEYKDALNDAGWKPLATERGYSSHAVVTLTDPSANPKQRFYRVRVE